MQLKDIRERTCRGSRAGLLLPYGLLLLAACQQEFVASNAPGPAIRIEVTGERQYQVSVHAAPEKYLQCPEVSLVAADGRSIDITDQQGCRPPDYQQFVSIPAGLPAVYMLHVQAVDRFGRSSHVQNQVPSRVAQAKTGTDL